MGLHVEVEVAEVLVAVPDVTPEPVEGIAPDDAVVAVVEAVVEETVTEFEAVADELPPLDDAPTLCEYTDSLYEAPQATLLFPPQAWLHSDAA